MKKILAALLITAFSVTAAMAGGGGFTGGSGGGSGDIEGVTAGTNINGGGTSGTVTVNVDDEVEFAGPGFSVGISTFVTKGGKVGIGTTNPSTKIHVSSGALAIDGTSPSITIGDTVAPSLGQLAIHGAAASDVSLELFSGSSVVRLFDNSGSNPAFAWLAGKIMRLGFGNQAGSSFTGGWYLSDNGGSLIGRMGFNYATPIAQIDLVSGVAPTASILNISSQNVTTGDIMRINGNGNIGMGSTAPATKLHISSGVLTIDGTSPGISVAGVGIVGTDGKIPALSSTYLASLSGANLTTLTAANISAGSLGASVIASSVAAQSVYASGLASIDSPADNEVFSFDAATGKVEYVAASGGGDAVLANNQTFSGKNIFSGAVTVTSSVTVSGAGGIGVTYGVSASTGVFSSSVTAAYFVGSGSGPGSFTSGTSSVTVGTSGNSTLFIGYTSSATVNNEHVTTVSNTQTLTNKSIDISQITGGAAGANAYDFGGSTSLEIPNGTGNTIDTEGEIGFDTTDDVLVMYDGVSAKVIAQATNTYTVTIASGTSWNSLAIPVFRAPSEMAITLTKVYAESLPSGTSVQFNLEERAAGSVNSAGTDAFNVLDSTANGTGQTITAFANASIAANASLVFTTPSSGADAGSTSMVTFTIYYLKDRE